MTVNSNKDHPTLAELQEQARQRTLEVCGPCEKKGGPAGWWCTRDAGHSGPCAAVQYDTGMSAAEVIGLLTLTPAPDGLDDDQIRIWNIYEKARLTALKKNLAYGSSVFTKGALTPELNADAAIRVRMGDKISRLRTLLANPEKNMVSDESISDTMMDLATYALLWLIAKEKGI